MDDSGDKCYINDCSYNLFPQVIGLVYRPFSVVTTQSTGVKVILIMYNYMPDFALVYKLSKCYCLCCTNL